MERVKRMERMEREATPRWHWSRRGEDEIFVSTQNVLCSVRNVGWKEYWNLFGSCGSESISAEWGMRGGGIHTLRAASCSCFFCFIKICINITFWSYGRTPVCRRRRLLSGKVRWEGVSPRNARRELTGWKYMPLTADRLGVWTIKTGFHYHFHAVEAAFCLVTWVTPTLAGTNWFFNGFHILHEIVK